MPTKTKPPSHGTGILSSHRIALAGTQFGPLNYTSTDVQRFITTAGGTYLTKVTSFCTILICSEKAWQAKAPQVVTALQKYKDKVSVVKWDWLEDCVMKSRRCLKPKRYLWRKPEKKAKVGVLGDWRKPERRVGGGQEMDERTRKREKKADVETELRKGRYHVYGDKGIDYDVSLTRCDEAGVFVERYRICLHTNTTTFKKKLLYATTTSYTSTTKSTKPEYLAEPGSNWATAYGALELFFQGKTGKLFCDVMEEGNRVVANGLVVGAKGLKKVDGGAYELGAVEEEELENQDLGDEGQEERGNEKDEVEEDDDEMDELATPQRSIDVKMGPAVKDQKLAAKVAETLTDKSDSESSDPIDLDEE